jgi:two-component system NtrC family sensor kinase
VQKVPKQLAFRLILSLTVLVAVIEAISAYVNARTQERQLLAEMVRGADQLSRSVTSATWHAMLADRRDDAYQTMETIAREQGIEQIRFFNKEGRITFSTAGEAGTYVDMNAEACTMCHARQKPLVRLDMPTRARTLRTATGERRLGMITPIYNEPACSQAACHAHPEGRSVLGVLDVTMDLSHVDREMADLQRRMLGMALVQFVVVGVFIVFFTRKFVGVPIRKLIEGTRQVSAMELDKDVAIETPGELGELVDSFNVMRERLRTTVGELNALTASLEQKVDERTKQLSLAQQKLVQSDKLASLGQLAASVAHEINNPISGVLNLSVLMDRVLKDDGIPKGREAEFRRYLRQITDETARVGRIVSDLLSFSRRSAPQHAAADLNGLLTRTLGMLAHRMHLGEVDVDTILATGLPQVPCDVQQIQQVVINLVLNAAEAMHAGGRVTVRTMLDTTSDAVVLEVADDGPGIATANIQKIFDPFFTTKEEGKGVGLGLAVVYGIVQAHGGTIDVRSKPGEGATFTVRLPLHPTGVQQPVTVVGRPPTGLAV